MKSDIRDLTLERLNKEITDMGEEAHRARQIFLWLNQKNADNFEMMTNLSKNLITKLNKKFIISKIECIEHLKSKDKTEKFLWRLDDGEYIESVLIREKDRRTLCLSTQVGCRFKCSFCASGTKGLVRNLTVGEIVCQLLYSQKLCSCRMTNIVFMGMGEPLDNYDNLKRSIRIINDPDGIALGARKITISTCGIVPGILKLKNLGVQVELSVSLYAASDKLRDELVPANRRYPLKKLIKACREYYDHTGRVITLEYTLIQGKNDSERDAKELAKISKNLKAKVNLIAYNFFENAKYKASGKDRTEQFKAGLRSMGVNVTLRRSRGEDIMAACGQLAAQHAEGNLHK